MKKIYVSITTNLEIEIDPTNPIVQGYEDDRQIINECAGFQFSNVLPVIESGGVRVTNIDVDEIDW